MQLSESELKAMFVAAGHVSEENFLRAVSIAKKSNVSIESELMALGLLSDYNIGKTIADACELEFVDLTATLIPEPLFEIIPEIVARAQQAVVYNETASDLYVATLHPDNYEFKKLLEKKTGKTVHFAYAAYGALLETLNEYKGDYDSRLNKLLESCINHESEAVVVEFVDLLLEYGFFSKASDIHIEPRDHEVSVRFRVDGVLHEVIRYPVNLHDQISFRIKILSQLQTDERGKAQDGRFSDTVAGTKFDVRVSIIPITDGENIVLRLLSAHSRQFTLSTLGFSPADLKKVLKAIRQPHGMILTVGPTGSGKTTALYSILEELNKPEINIMTIEDPVEYDIEGVQQTQVNPSKDLVFSSGLRVIVRQDPDIIMVGEIRDEETADIAVNAALTGHLLLSTLHTNDAATTFPRLGEMKIKPFLVASSVRIVISIRLVRKICPHCRCSYFLSDEELSLIENEQKITAMVKEISAKDDLQGIRFYHGSGCKVCNKSGFLGRTAIFEVLLVDEKIRALIANNATSDEINNQALKSGMQPLLHDGIAKSLQGITTLMEVVKAVHM